jgi:hypothetical protein
MRRASIGSMMALAAFWCGGAGGKAGLEAQRRNEMYGEKQTG